MTESQTDSSTVYKECLKLAARIPIEIAVRNIGQTDSFIRSEMFLLSVFVFVVFHCL